MSLAAQRFLEGLIRDALKVHVSSWSLALASFGDSY